MLDQDPMKFRLKNRLTISSRLLTTQMSLAPASEIQIIISDDEEEGEYHTCVCMTRVALTPLPMLLRRSHTRAQLNSTPEQWSYGRRNFGRSLIRIAEQ